MKARIIDNDALRAITPAALVAYARGEGWVRIEPFGIHSDVYAGTQEVERPELVIPRTSHLGDYAEVVGKLITYFAQTGNRDELAVYRDLIGADRDVVRVRSRGADDEGSVSIDAGVAIVTHSRDMLLAAACAVRNPQALYRAGANKDASDYMQRVRLGQTEQGSFVVTLLAPVPPQLQTQLDPTWAGFADEPFERQVTRRLMKALQASLSAIEATSIGEGSVAFERAIQQGVSANLCEALAKLIESSEGLDVSTTWARTRPTPEARRTITFSSDDAKVLQEAARTFRAHRPRPNVQLFGTVHQLKRDQDEVDGLITLKAAIDGKLQSVKVVLDRANYSLAVTAHEHQLPVLIRGDLERFGQRWQLSSGELIDLVGYDSNEADEVGYEQPG
jgi:hypothetical protein